MEKPRTTQRTDSSRVTGDLGERIARAQARRPAEAGAERARQAEATGFSRGFRLASEFIAAIIVGAGAGFLLDQWLHTTPWLMLVMLMIGFAAGVLNVIRSANEMNRAAPPAPDLGSDDEDD